MVRLKPDITYGLTETQVVSGFSRTVLMILEDARHSLRTLWRSKGFALSAILCLGFGIGLNTTSFSLIDGVLLKPFPYKDPDRLLVVGTQNQRAGARDGLSYLDLRDWN